MKSENYFGNMLASVKVVSNLVSYYNNGFRMWGGIHRQIMDEPSISRAYFDFIRRERETRRLVDEIGRIRGRSVYEVIRKLAWEVEDMAISLENLTKVVGSSGVINQNLSHECISGEGRRLGLRTLMSRSLPSVRKLHKIAFEMLRIANNEGF